MKRFHVHVGVQDLDASIRFYSALFGAEPAVRKADYAKWMVEDPRINFAISQRGDGRRVAGEGSRHQRRPALGTRDVDVGAGAQQAAPASPCTCSSPKNSTCPSEW